MTTQDGKSEAADGSVAPQPKKSKAGRALGPAIVVGVLMAVVAISSLMFEKRLFLVVIVAAIIVGTDELTKAFKHQGIKLARFPLLLSTVVLPLVAYTWGMGALLAAFGAAFLLVLAFSLRTGVDGFVANVSTSTFVLAYAPLMGGFAALLVDHEKGGAWGILFIVLTICSDIGGYIAGVLSGGKHKMAPGISPAKSWEGFAGSLALQATLGAILFPALLDEPFWKGIVMGLVMTVTATIGDFVESAMKRDIGIKDMSDLLPGHGGLMDRLDSLIPNTFVAWVMLSLLTGSPLAS